MGYNISKGYCLYLKLFQQTLSIGSTSFELILQLLSILLTKKLFTFCFKTKLTGLDRQQISFCQICIRFEYKFGHRLEEFDNIACIQQYNLHIVVTFHCQGSIFPGKCRYTKTLCKHMSAKSFQAKTFSIHPIRL